MATLGRLEDRIGELERKIDLLLQRSVTTVHANPYPPGLETPPAAVPRVAEVAAADAESFTITTEFGGYPSVWNGQG